jgi:tetratricopeptide (TPR) repeat protein
MKYPSKFSTRAAVVILSLTVIHAIVPNMVSAEELTAEQYYKRGSQGIVDGQNAAAVEDFDRALQKDPQYWKAYGARSAARYNCGDYQGALKDIDIAIAHVPPKQSLIDHKALCKKAIANQSAQAQNQETRKMAQQMLLNAQLGINFGMQGDLILMAARKKAGLNPLTGLPLGTSITPASAASRTGNIDPASPSAVSSRLEAMNPGANLPPVKIQVAPMNNQAVASSAVPSESAGKAQPVTLPVTTNEHMTAQQYFDRACGKGHASDFAGALKDYDEAIRLNPQHGPAYANRGSIRFNTGDHKGALEDFNKAVSLMPDNKGVKDLRDVVIKAIGQ